jgi:hypothetical protein
MRYSDMDVKRGRFLRSECSPTGCLPSWSAAPGSPAVWPVPAADGGRLGPRVSLASLASLNAPDGQRRRRGGNRINVALTRI